jgi:hypothetical protein
MISESGNKFMRTPFRPGTLDVRGGFKKLRNEGIHVLDPSPWVRAVSRLMENSIFCNIAPTEVSEGHGHCLLPAFTLVSCLAYSSTLKKGATCSSETLTDVQRNTRHITENKSLHNHSRDNLKLC